MRSRTSSRRKAPVCTHVTMERVPLSDPNSFSCPSCGNFRTLGFLYVCRQERDMAYLESLPGQDPDCSTKSPLRRELEHIGLSESVITTAEHGFYTDKQLEKLKNGKLELNRVVAGAHQAGCTKKIAVKVSVDAQCDLPNTDGTLHSMPEAQEQTTQVCQLVACHHCRPYFKDRVSTSFDAVFNDEIRPFHPAEADYLAIKSARILRTIGSRPFPGQSPSKTDATPSTLLGASGYQDDSSSAPSRSSMLTYRTTQSEIDGLNATRRHRRRFYMVGRRSSGEIRRDIKHQMTIISRQGLKEAFKGVLRASERESSSSGSNITLPMPRTAAARDSCDEPSVREFDMGALHRVKRQKERYDLRHAAECGTHPRGCGYNIEDLSRDGLNRATDGESNSSGSRVSVYSCVSEGSEIEVGGGVALTEEAVETHTPDIIDSSLTGESIMTQA